MTADGTLTGGRVWAETIGAGKGVADGMKIDAEQNVWCAGPGGIHLFDPAGACLGVLLMPEHAANLVFGDEMQSVYVTAATSIYRVRSHVPGILTY